MRKKIVGIVLGIMLLCSGCGQNGSVEGGSDNQMTNEDMTQEAPDPSDGTEQDVPASSVQPEPDWAQGVQSQGQLYQGLDLDGIGDADDEAYVSVYQFGDDEADKVTVLRVHLGTGETLASVLPVYGFIEFQTGRVCSEDRDSIVLEIEVPASNYSAANLYVLNVEYSDPGPVPRLVFKLDTATSRGSNYLIDSSDLSLLSNQMIRGTEIVDMRDRALQGIKVPIYESEPAGQGEEFEYILYWEDEKWVLAYGYF